jgi:HEAT repeat protein
LDIVGHPATYFGIKEYIGGPLGWNVPTVVDEPALTKCGVRLNSIWPYSQLRTGGISRRSSLRFVLDKGGLAYYVNDSRVVITTKQLARVKWQTYFAKPEPASLDSSSIADRREAVFAAPFWHLDPDLWIMALANLLDDVDRQVCFDAAYALGEFGPQATGAIDQLVTVIRAKDSTRREGALFALGNIGPPAINRLIELLDDRDTGVALAAAKSFDVMGSVGKQAIPGLFDAAERHADSTERSDSIALAIGNIDPTGSVPTLHKLLKSERDSLRAFAAVAIAEIGPVGRGCASDLLALLTDQNTRVRIAAARAMASIDLPADFPTVGLERALSDPDEHVRLWANAALRRIKLKKQQMR